MKEFLSREGVSYQEKNVAYDRQAAQEMVNLTGQMGVPVTAIAGQAIVGFNQPALKAAVGRLRQQAAAPSTGPGDTIKLGAQIGDAARLLPQQGLPARSGALLGAVRPGSLAAAGGLRQGDIITGLNGQPVENADGLARALQTAAARQTPVLDITFWRDGVQMNTRLPLA